MEVWPAVVVITCCAAGMPVSATAELSLSALAWVASPCGMDTVYWAPPTNSMPKLSPRK